MKRKTANKSVSVIICAKNEAKNLEDFLPSIILQKHPNFEIILVNDHSTDDTLNVMQFFANIHSNIRIVNLSGNSNSNKKNAVTKGIEKSKYENLLFTDADCTPVSLYWISEMYAHFSPEKKIILGYGAYRKIKGSWLNKLIRFETVLTAIQYFSYAKIKLPYMAVGRNMAYKRSDFYQVAGFNKHKHIKSGDDDLFINQIATSKNVACCYSPNSFTMSEPHTNFNKWIHQKRRHITTATSYKFIHQLLLGLFYSSQLLFWVLGVFLLFTSLHLYYIIAIFTFRILSQYIIFGSSLKKLKETDLFLLIPFLELFLILIQLRIFIANLIEKPKNWN